MNLTTNQATEFAYNILKKEKNNLNFYKLWDKVTDQLKWSKTDKHKISEFYMGLLLDKRFVMMGNNLWSLRDNFKYEDIEIKISSVYDLFKSDEEEIETPNEEDFIPKTSEDLLESELKELKTLPSDIDVKIEHSDDDVISEINNDINEDEEELNEGFELEDLK